MPVNQTESGEPLFPPAAISVLREALTAADLPRAAKITSPHHLAAETLGKVFNVDAGALARNLETEAERINGGCLAGIEGTLASQAATLNAMFHRFCQVACAEPRTLDEFSGYMKLALRAQSQSAAAFEILAGLKQGPRVVITRQLNAANQQVVNNHPDPAGMPRARKARIVRPAQNAVRARDPLSTVISRPSPQLSTLSDHAPLEPRSPGETKPVHPPLAAMEPVHRSQKPRRKANQQPER